MAEPYQLSEPFAIGRTSQLYMRGPGQVLKLFHRWVDRGHVQAEERATRLACELGLPAPKVGGLLEMEDRLGLLFEHVPGVSMLKSMQTRPWQVLGSAKRFAALHSKMHGLPAPADLPSQIELLEEKLQHADIPEELRARMLRFLASLPAGQCLCHGDFHPGNVIAGGKGEVIVDWPDASRGNPVADVARTSILVLGSAYENMGLSTVVKTIAGLYNATYLRHYFRLRPERRDEYRYWLPIIAATRLSECDEASTSWLLSEAGKCAPYPA